MDENVSSKICVECVKTMKLMKKKTLQFQSQAKNFMDAANQLRGKENKQDKTKSNESETIEMSQIINQVRYYWSDPENRYQKCHVLLFDHEEQKYKVRNTDGQNFLIDMKLLCEEAHIKEFL